MKALLYKDFLLLWKQGRSTLLWVVGLTVVSLLLLKGVAIVNGIILLYLLLLVPADLNAHWLEPLPISPKVQVWSKYIVLWILQAGHFLLVLLLAAVVPSTPAMVRTILVTFLVYWCICLGLQAFFFPILFMFGTSSKFAFSFFFLCCFLGYFAGLIPLGLVRESPLTVMDVLPYVGILWVTSVISVFLAIDQYRKAWPTGKMS